MFFLTNHVLKFIAKHPNLSHITPDLNFLTHIHINDNNYFRTEAFIKVAMTKMYLNKSVQLSYHNIAMQ